MKLTHFSNEPSLVVHTVQQPDDPRHKPIGLWVSVDGPDDWIAWCTSECFWPKKEKHRYTIRLVNYTNVLVIDDAPKLRDFSKKYEADGISYTMHIRWDAVAQHYGGIIIAPYLWSCRMDGDMLWYYSWDCASGCIWDHRCIHEVTYVGKHHFNGRESVTQ